MQPKAQLPECGDDCQWDDAPYSMIGTATTLPKDEDYQPQPQRPIGFIWSDDNGER